MQIKRDILDKIRKKKIFVAAKRFCWVIRSLKTGKQRTNIVSSYIDRRREGGKSKGCFDRSCIEGRVERMPKHRARMVHI